MTPIRSTGDFWRSALTSGLTLECAAIIVALLVMGGACVVILVRTGRFARKRVPLWADTDGTATVEFALVLPILLFMTLTLAQTTLVMGGNLFVHYSAFAAARSAIVQIPYEYADCPANQCYPGTQKFLAIQRTAAYALVPVSGPWSYGGSSIPPEPYQQAFNRFFSTYGQEPPAWVTNLAGERLMYADRNTTIEVLQAVAIDSNTSELREPLGGTFGPKDAIGVRVHHNLNLSMPYANLMWSDGTQPNGRGRYMKVSAHAVLTNEGVLDTMPPTPSIPRVP